MTLATIRTGLKTRLETISGLRVFERPPDSINQLPTAFILPLSGNYNYAMNTGIEYNFEITVLVSRAADVADAQTNIDPYIDRSGTKSIYAAVDGDPTLGGACSNCRVTDFRDYGGLAYGGIEYLGVKLSLKCYG